MKVPFSPPDITEAEIEKVSEVLRSGWITTGPVTKQLETDISSYCGRKRTACLASATAAMELALRVLGIGPGDEVITSAYTYSASASVIEHVGATIKFADTVAGGVSIDPASVAALITERTKAIIPVDIGGIPADYTALFAVLEEKKTIFSPDNEIQRQLGRVAIVGDAAHAFGAHYLGKDISAWSDFCCFSFHAVKNLTTAEGGAVCFDDIGGISADEIYRQFMLLSLHGQSKDALAKTQLGSWEYDILLPAYKCNMTDILAAIGAVQLERYDGMLARRREIFGRFDAHFLGSRVKPLLHKAADYESSYHAYIVRIDGLDVDSRNRLLAEMGARDIALNVHYKPLPMMTAYKNLGFDVACCPNAYDYFRATATLPSFSQMSDAEVDYVAENLLELLGRVEFRDA